MLATCALISAAYARRIDTAIHNQPARSNQQMVCNEDACASSPVPRQIRDATVNRRFIIDPAVLLCNSGACATGHPV